MIGTRPAVLGGPIEFQILYNINIILYIIDFNLLIHIILLSRNKKLQ
jgi:hypothetical protein